MTEPCRVLVADPPWRFGDKLPGPKRGASKHYRTMTIPEICSFLRAPSLISMLHSSSGHTFFGDLAPSAVLFLWRVSSMVEEAYQVCRAWGFTPKSEVVWVKTNKHSPEFLAMGMGHIVRGAHETCIVATRGKLLRPASRSERTVIFAPRGRHSEKPEAFYRLVERLYPHLGSDGKMVPPSWAASGSHVELFARRQRPGWVCVGDELGEATCEADGAWSNHGSE